jgi:UDP-galactose transporter B1
MAKEEAKSGGIHPLLKLAFGAGGIYISFLSYGVYHSQIFKYQDANGEKFKHVFFLQALEAAANVVIAGIALLIIGSQKSLPLQLFLPAGAGQVFAKASMSLALANGLAFSVATLAKSAKMVPVMAGDIILGGKVYKLMQYLSVGAVIAGTVIVTMDSDKKKKGSEESSMWGIFFICLSLTFDGIVGGMQGKLKKATKDKIGEDIKPYDMMFWTNLVMGVTALCISLSPFRDTTFAFMPTTEFEEATTYLTNNPALLEKLAYFAGCSAAGQSFIFYTISNFDSLTCTTVTTTRKVMSVLIAIFTDPTQSLSEIGWGGLGLATVGISMEIVEKMEKKEDKGEQKEKKKTK